MKKGIRKIKAVAQTIVGREPIFFLLGGIFLVLWAGLIGTTNSQWYIPREWGIPYSEPLLIFIPGALLVYLGFKYTEVRRTTKDLTPFWGRLGLAASLVIAVSIRLYHMDIPFGGWWGDQQNEFYDAWQGYVHHHIPLMYEWGARPSFPTWIQAFVFALFPDGSGPAQFKVTTTFFDLATLATFYLLGKEVGNRRTGLFMVALGAISRELLIRSFQALQLAAFPFCISLSLLAFFRVLHKPVLSRYLQWGFTLALGFYLYDGYRAWVPFAILALASWVLWQVRRTLGIWAWGTLLTGTTAWLLWLFRATGIFSGNSILSGISGIWIDWGLAALAVGSLTWVNRLYKKEKASRRLLNGFAAGLALAALALYPIASDPIFHSRGGTIMDLGSLLNPLALAKFLVGSFGRFIEVCFIQGGDLWISGPDRTSLFSLYSALWILVGSALLLAKPSKDLIWTAFAIIPGLLPYFLVQDPHQGRLMGSVPAFFLLAALGMDRIWTLFSSSFRSLPWRLAGFSLGALLWGWAGWANFQCVWAYSDIPQTGVYAAQQAETETSHGLVYVAPFLVDYSNFTMLEALIKKRDINGLGDSNPIFLAHGEKTPDVVVLCPNQDEKHRKLLRSQYPNAQWVAILERPTQKLDFFFWKVVISGDQIGDRPGTLFFTQEKGPTAWTREFYGASYGLCRGLVLFRDEVAHLQDPVPWTRMPLVNWDRFSARLVKDLEVPAAGDYLFTLPSTGCVRLTIDDGKARELVCRRTYGAFNADTRKIHLEKGTYRLELRCAPQERGLPHLTLCPPGGSPEAL